MKMLLRPAQERDVPTIKKMLEPWIDADPAVAPSLEDYLRSEAQSSVKCRVVETDRTLRCFSLWRRTGPDRIRLLALGIANGASETGADVRLLQDDIRHWADLRIAKAKIRVPENLGPLLIRCLRACGFMTEGVVSNLKGKPRIRLCKHFIYRKVSHTKVLSLLGDFFVSMGYEIQPEEDGFAYRIPKELRRPFIFSTWHRIARHGSDIVIYPPAHKIEWHELETLFYPLAIRGPREKPIIVPLDKAMAADLIEIPAPASDPHQETLFGSECFEQPRMLPSRGLVYCYPVGIKHLRRGLPIMFYVKRIGAVGTARIEKWTVDDPRNLYNRIDDMSAFDPEDVKDQVGGSGSNAGKVLAIRFNWYDPFKRVVTFEEFREKSTDFNPQKTRLLSSDLFQSVVTAGTGFGDDPA